jgi:hypothetical protein
VDLDGRELIDLHLNGGTFNLGTAIRRSSRRSRPPDSIPAIITSPAGACELAGRLAEPRPALTYTVFAAAARRSTSRSRPRAGPPGAGES